MDPVSVVLVGILALAAIVGGVMFLVYNRLTVQKNRFQNAFAQIDVQLKRRYDLIPGLVAAARAYLSHEREVLEAVIKARDVASGLLDGASEGPSPSPAALRSLNEADLSLNKVLDRLMIVMESYPNLKADQAVSDLAEELRSAENRVSAARQAFNDSVMFYNQAREVFPNLLFSGMFGFGKADLWELGSRVEAEAPAAGL